MLDLSDIAPERPRPIRRSEFEHMVESGVFDKDKIELLRGVIIEMSPHGTQHSYALRKLSMLLSVALVNRADVSSQTPFAASDDSLPEPDISVVPANVSANVHPRSAFLLVEIAESSLRKDTGTKAALYAEAGVPEYWVVDLARSVVIVHTQPCADGYVSRVEHQKGGTMTLVAFADVRISCSAFLP